MTSLRSCFADLLSSAVSSELLMFLLDLKYFWSNKFTCAFYKNSCLSKDPYLKLGSVCELALMGRKLSGLSVLAMFLLYIWTPASWVVG